MHFTASQHSFACLFVTALLPSSAPPCPPTCVLVSGFVHVRARSYAVKWVLWGGQGQLSSSRVKAFRMKITN